MAVLAEERVIEAWLALAGSGHGLVTTGGPVTVLAPGRRNDDHGADFLDAILATRRGIIVGDIEVHVLSSGWRAHGHDADPAYNRVVLHVVRRHDAGRDALLANGRRVPTLVLEHQRAAPARDLLPPALPDTERWLPCRESGRSPDEAAAVLDGAGMERFEERAAGFRAALTAGSRDRILYAGLLAALGYRRNRGPMARLAAALPPERLVAVSSRGGGAAAGRAAAEGLLIGTAGLLPSQRTRRFPGETDHPWVRKLEAAWKKYGGDDRLAEADWHHARVRPGNYPVRRLAAMARLLERYRPEGLAAGLLNGCRAAGTPRNLAALVAVPAAGFWQDCLDFGLPAAGAVPALCGAGRAADLVVNVILPFAAAWHGRRGDGEGARAAVNAYRSHPALADNVVVGEVCGRLRLPRPATALRQQGMLQLHRDFCEKGRCRACPLG